MKYMFCLFLSCSFPFSHLEHTIQQEPSSLPNYLTIISSSNNYINHHIYGTIKRTHVLVADWLDGNTTGFIPRGHMDFTEGTENLLIWPEWMVYPTMLGFGGCPLVPGPTVDTYLKHDQFEHFSMRKCQHSERTAHPLWILLVQYNALKGFQSVLY